MFILFEFSVFCDIRVVQNKKKKNKNKCLFGFCFLKLFYVLKNKENRENTLSS